MHHMALRPSFVPQHLPLPSPPASSLADGPDPESDLVCAASSTVPRLLATVVTDPSFESAATLALVAELVDFAAACCLDYAAILLAESEFDCPLSVGGECALGTDIFEDRQEDFEYIPTPRSYAEAITDPYSSQWQTAMDAEMASWNFTGTYVDALPPPGANIVDGMWIFRGVDFFHTFSPTPKMTIHRVLLHVDAQRNYELHSLNLWRPFYGLRLAPREWHDTLRLTLAALGFAPSTIDPSLFLRTDTSLPPFYVLVYVDASVFATADTETLALAKSELQKRHPCTDLGPSALRLLSVELSGPYPELVGCLMYPMTSTRPDLAYPLSILARYVAPGRHRLEHWEAAKRVLRYLCSTSSMGLVLGGWGPVVFTGHADASWVDDLAAQRSSQGYTFSLGSGSISWRSTCSSSVLSSSCEAEIYAEAIAAQELRWLTYLLTDLGEQRRSSPVLYVDNKAMIALC
ncbi:unnamed protein product [Closterium sp. NIES-53]